jgi:hypothetical protein
MARVAGGVGCRSPVTKFVDGTLKFTASESIIVTLNNFTMFDGIAIGPDRTPPG